MPVIAFGSVSAQPTSQELLLVFPQHSAPRAASQAVHSACAGRIRAFQQLAVDSGCGSDSVVSVLRQRQGRFLALSLPLPGPPGSTLARAVAV